MGKFEMSRRANGEHQFNLKADNRQTVLSSEGYLSKSACENGIESVRKNAPVDENYSRNQASNGKHYFTLKAANKQVIGTSQMYESKAGMEGGIASVKANAPEATVVEV